MIDRPTTNAGARPLRSNGNRVCHHGPRRFCRGHIRLARSVVNEGLRGAYLSASATMGSRGGALVRMAVWLVVPSAVGPQANLTFEIWRHLDAPPLFPR